MPIPDYQSLMLPILRVAADGEVRISDVVERLADEFQLSAEDRAAPCMSGGQLLFANRVHWAKTHLGKARLVDFTGRGLFRISDLGRRVLADPPAKITVKFLKQFSEFGLARKPINEHEAPIATDSAEDSGFTPDELMRQGHIELEQELGQELLQRIQAAPPAFFERLVVQLLVAMGYGGSAERAGRALAHGKSGDGGIDGIIDQDALGLDRVYVQAKRYADDNIVGPEAIRGFFGALDTFKAAKGLFITTSGFSAAATRTAETLSKRIVLINGQDLARLMIRFNVGCRIEDTLYIRKVDEGFFE